MNKKIGKFGLLTQNRQVSVIGLESGCTTHVSHIGVSHIGYINSNNLNYYGVNSIGHSHKLFNPPEKIGRIG